MKKIGVVIYVLLVLVSCKDPKKEKELQHNLAVYNSWIGKTLVFPKNPAKTNWVNGQYDSFTNRGNYIIITVFDIGCSSCMETLDEWKKFNTVMNKYKIHTVFIIPPELVEMYNREKPLFAGLTLYFDNNYDFIEDNQISPDKALQTFLVDKNNKVVILGNPITNNKISEIYMNFVEGVKN